MREGSLPTGGKSNLGREPMEEQACWVDVLVYMERDGTIAREFDPESSSITAEQRREVKVRVMP